MSKCSLPSGLSDEPFGDTLAPPHVEPESVEGGSPAIFGQKIDGSPPSTVPSATMWSHGILNGVPHSSPSPEAQNQPS